MVVPYPFPFICMIIIYMTLFTKRVIGLILFIIFIFTLFNDQPIIENNKNKHSTGGNSTVGNVLDVFAWIFTVMISGMLGIIIICLPILAYRKIFPNKSQV